MEVSEQAERFVKPFVLMYRLEHGGVYPSIERISEAPENSPWDDYFYAFTYDYLELL